MDGHRRGSEMETSSPPRNRASLHLDPHLGTRADAREPMGTGFPAFGCTEGSLAPGHRLRAEPAGRRSPNVLQRPRVPQEPARAPTSQPCSRGPAHTPHTHEAAPPGLTPVPLSHTTTFLPWLSMVRPGEPPPGLACFLLHTAPPSARRSAQTGSPRPAAAPRGRCREKREPGLAAEKANES